MNRIQDTLDYAASIADWFLEIGERHCQNGDLESALKYTQLGATVLCRQSRNLSCTRLETNLHLTAQRLVELHPETSSAPHNPSHGELCLHVLDEALPAGGLTAMATRWIRNDRSGRAHSVALLSQHVPVPDALLHAVRDSGGNVYPADETSSLVSKAAWLRQLAHSRAQMVVLHTGVTDVICGAAFGQRGGPPILLVNHAAHIFWAGVSIPDVVVNCRGSALEAHWTRQHRNARCVTVPIPLPEPTRVADRRQSPLDLKHAAKRAMGIPSESPVILTVGAAFKYTPVGGLDFLAALEGVLSRVPHAILVAVGFEADSRWRDASERLGSRIRTVGVVGQDALAAIHEATDIYVEGFPFGSTTALLEAALKGIPVVLPPSSCPPPYTTDGAAVDGLLARPVGIREFQEEIVTLCLSSSVRTSRANQVRDAVELHHTGDGWRQYLEAAISALPPEHSVMTPTNAEPTPQATHEYWATFVAETDSGYEETLEHAVTRALLMGMCPAPTEALIAACRRHRNLRRHRTIPLPLLTVLCTHILPSLPKAWASKVFRSLSFVFRESLLLRLRRRTAKIIAGEGSGRRSWYEDYRNVQLK